MKIGKLIVFTGPSGSGKGTVEEKFINEPEFNFYFTVSATTRPIRDNEVEGVHHLFIDKEQFEKWIEEDKFLEYATFVDNYYGTIKEEVERELANGKNVFLEIELEGAKQVMKKMPEALSIFLAPPSIEELENRLRKRGSESGEIIQARINKAKEELSFADDKSIFKYKVINDDVDRAAEEIKDIIRKESNL